MDVEAASEKMMEMLLEEGKHFRRLSADRKNLFFRRIATLIAAEELADLQAMNSLKLKFYNGFYQIWLDGDYRIWFKIDESGTILLEDCDEGNH